MSKLIGRFEELRHELLTVKNEEKRKEVFRVECEIVFENFDNKTTTDNVKRLIEHFLSNPAIGALDIIDDITRRFNEEYHEMIRKVDEIDRFDEINNTSTNQILEQFELNEHMTLQHYLDIEKYVPSPSRLFTQILKIIPNYGFEYKDSIFIDVGSGMGRNLMLASTCPFKKIIGIEISNYLNEKARNNLNTFDSSNQKCKDIELYHGNALDFEFPKENVILYFYAPFLSESVAFAFFDRLHSFLEQAAVKAMLIFLESDLQKRYRTVFKKRDLFDANSFKRLKPLNFTLNIYDNWETYVK